jgi:hypothetical protein
MAAASESTDTGEAGAVRARAMRRGMLMLGAVAVAIGTFAFFYRGPGRTQIRGHLGDVGASMLVYALLGLIWRAGIGWRTLVAAGIALSLELRQACGDTPRGLAGEILVGAFFDPWDLVAYALGLGLAVLWEWQMVAARDRRARGR